MSQLNRFSAAVQKNIVKTAYECLERIRDSSESTKLTVKPMKNLVYQLACHSLIEEVLIEFFLPKEVMTDKVYMDVEWKDTFKIIEMAAPPFGNNYEFYINKTLRKEMYDLMRDSDEIDEAMKAEEEGRKLEEQAKELGVMDILERVEEEQDFEDRFSVKGDSDEEEEEVTHYKGFLLLDREMMEEFDESEYVLVEETDCQ